MTRIMRDLKRGELTIKDMSTQRETLSAKAQHKQTSAMIKDYSLQHLVKMNWRQDETNRDLIPFYLTIDNKKYLLSWAELKEADLAGFFRRDEGNPTRYNMRYFDGRHITLDTGLNEEAQRDMIFRLLADDMEVFLDWYEVLKAGRFI